MAGFRCNKVCHVYLPYCLDRAYFVYAKLHCQIMCNNYNCVRRKNKAAVNLKTVLRFTVALFFLLKLFSSHIYCIPKDNCVIFT